MNKKYDTDNKNTTFFPDPESNLEVADILADSFPATWQAEFENAFHEEWQTELNETFSEDALKDFWSEFERSFPKDCRDD